VANCSELERHEKLTQQKEEISIMKDTLLFMAIKDGAKRIPAGFGCALAVALLHLNAAAQDVGLGTANNFAVLAGTAITSTGSTLINGGNVGESPGSTLTGFTSTTMTPPYTATDLGDAVALTAENDLTTAYNTAVGLLPVTRTLTGTDLGGLTLTPGVYFFATSAQLTGKLTLNDMGNPDAVFVFQIGSTLTTASDSSVVSINSGAKPGSIPGVSVFWQVGSSATLGTGTDFEGNILALTSITADTGADVDGRLLARNGAVTLDDNIITAPPAEVLTGGGGPGGSGTATDAGSTLLLLGGGLATLVAVGRRFSSRRKKG
jgi:hypothetical protein